jgi:transmembrane 9 superfamily protein 2/4
MQDYGSLDCGKDLPPLRWELNKESPTLEVLYSYSVTFVESDLKWASRWDTYLQSGENTSIQWFSIANSVIIVMFLSGMVAIILVRTLHKDINRYNQQEKEEAQEEFGWKLVHGDVFRPPAYGMLLSVLLGSGTQLTLMTIVTLFFACLGFLSPATRGGLMTAMLILWVCLGTPAGYVSSRIYKMFGGEKWKSNVILTSLLFPGLVFGIFFVLNLILWSQQSSAAIPFGTMLALVALWFCVSVPLTFLGAYLGFKQPVMEQPVRTNQIPRQIPAQAFYTKPLAGILMGGVLPFGCVFIQLFFILSSIWGHKLYYIFGFLFLVFAILCITTIESTILLAYFHLCAEDYHWWWRSFFTSAASGMYLMWYCIVFYVRRMEVDGFINFCLYFGYTLIGVMVFALVTGTIGFFGTFWFVRKIYSVVKVD